MPDRLRTTLTFNKSFTLINAGVAFGNQRFRPTYTYDVDPVLGSSAVPGFTELSALYGSYRVNWFRTIAAFSNQESFAEQVYMIPTSYDVTINNPAYQSYLSNRRCVKTLLGPLTGSGIGHLDSGRIGVDEFGGVAQNMSSDATVGSTLMATSPTENIFYAIGFEGPQVSVNGIFTTMTIYINIDFFEMLTPPT
jgi:hypothetical protein